MAALKKINLTGQIFNENVYNKPPIPSSRPSSAKFLNRGSGKLFPSAYHNRLLVESETQSGEHHHNHLENGINQSTKNNSDQSDNSMALVLHPSAKLDSSRTEITTPKSVPGYYRRTQSAKARSCNKKDSKSKPPRPRPVSAGNAYSSKHKHTDTDNKPIPVFDLSDKVIPDLFNIEREKLLALPDPRSYNKNSLNDIEPMHFNLPSSGQHDHNGDEVCHCKKGNLSKTLQKKLQPSVYGLKNQRQVFGCGPDLSSNNSNYEQYPYKFDADIDFDDGNGSDDGYPKRSVPETLSPLLPWLCEDVPQDVIGVDPTACLVFLSAPDWSELPEVPDPPIEDEDLPYITDITTPRPWNPKKYSHPFFDKKPVEEWVCKHRPHSTVPGDGDDNRTIYSKHKKKRTLHLPRMRTADVVKKEIRDLENLIKGVGTEDTDCSLVRYQWEISAFQDMLDVTLDMVPERLKNPPKPPDTFGLQKVCDDHDIVIDNIRQRVQECRHELANLEVEAGIESSRQYFRKRSNSFV